MSTLQHEWTRLYQLPQGADPQNRVRTLVVELGQPADWSALSMLWRGVQSDLDWPAPAIAVNGVDGHQLWFALEQPLAREQAMQCLDALRARYLGAVAPQRIRLLAGTDADAAAPVPALQTNGHWSAFVAADLAAIFSDEPWLDRQPSPDAQAQVLSGIACIPPAAFGAAWDLLLPADANLHTPPASAPPLTGSAPNPSAHQFLLSVMNDTQVPMPLRIEAAKALLPYSKH